MCCSREFKLLKEKIAFMREWIDRQEGMGGRREAVKQRTTDGGNGTRVAAVRTGLHWYPLYW